LSFRGDGFHGSETLYIEAVNFAYGFSPAAYS